MRYIGLTLALGALLFTIARASSVEAPAGFDGTTNGLVDQNTHQQDQKTFEEVEAISDGLGPIYNAQSCRECHQSPVSGGISQITELRVGHRNSAGQFVNPSVPIADGAAVITGRTLINDRAICPNGAFPDVELQERVPATENIRDVPDISQFTWGWIRGGCAGRNVAGNRGRSMPQIAK